MLITKEFEFSYAHILPNHKGKCSRLHGHNAILKVTISGPIHSTDTDSSDDGTVIDFAGLKDVVSRAVQMQIELDREDRAAGLLRWPGYGRYVHYQECPVIEKVEK